MPWYIALGEEVRGPYDDDGVIAAIRSGISPTVKVCEVGADQWRDLASWPAFAAALREIQPAPQPPAQATAAAPGSGAASGAIAFDPKRHVREFKRTCRQCGKVWHSLESREKELERRAGCSNCAQCGAAMGMCGKGGYSAGTMASQEGRRADALKLELDRVRTCPACGSRDYSEQPIVYEKRP